MRRRIKPELVLRISRESRPSVPPFPNASNAPGLNSYIVPEFALFFFMLYAPRLFYSSLESGYLSMARDNRMEHEVITIDIKKKNVQFSNDASQL